MATVQFDSVCAAVKHPPTKEQPPVVGAASKPGLHRIRTVRRLQGVSLRTAARQLGTTVSHVRIQENESTDLKLSELYRWQAVLDVPLEELLVESTLPLSRPVTERARLVLVMKTAATILEVASTPQLVRLAERLVDQLVELMPELREVGPWHSIGRRRSLEEYGRIAEQCFSDESLACASADFGD